MIVNASPYAAAYDPRTGEELWRYEDILGEVASSPAYSDGSVIIINQLLSILSIDAVDGDLLWEMYDDLPDTSSPLAVGELTIVATAYGVVTALRTGTGAVLWKTEFAEGFYASPVIAGGLIYLVDRTGVTRILRASDSYELIASPSLGEAADATPAFANGRIYLRGVDNLFCIGVAE